MRPRATSTTAYDVLACDNSSSNNSNDDDDDGDDLASYDDDDGAGTLSAVRRDQGESHRDLRGRGPEARDRGKDREVLADTGTVAANGRQLCCSSKNRLI
jgi:hypothetical protein